jgi:choline kinase
MVRNLKAIILAAGQGKRLNPLTNEKPKCMVELFGKSLIEHQINAYTSCGISDINVVTGFRSDSITTSNVRYFKNERYERTNMVESLFCAEEILNGNIIISYGDIIFEKNVLKQLIQSSNDFSVIIDKNWKDYWSIRSKNPLVDLESLKLDSKGDIISIGQKVKKLEEIQGQYIGLMKFSNKAVNILKDFYHECKKISEKKSNPLNANSPFEKSFMTDLLQGLINSNYQLHSVPIHGGWLELDTVEDFETYQRMFRNNTIKKFITLEA